MRTVLTSPVLILPVLSLALCVGCSKKPSEPVNTGESVDTETVAPPETDDWEKQPPLILPLEPLPLDSEEDSPTALETTGIAATVFGKYAAETIPLPPIDDLTAQIDEYITKIGSNLGNLSGSSRYAEDAADIVRDANALALVALAVGISEADSKYKLPASHIITAAKNLAAAKTFEEGKKAYESLKASLTNTTAGTPLSWSNKVADLVPVMRALPNLSSAVKRVTDTEGKLNTTLDRSAQTLYSQFAALAVLSQGSIPNVVETAKPDASAEWKQYCEEFRDAALKVNAAARQYAQDKANGKEPDYAVFNANFRVMTESCEHCHEVFYPRAVGLR